MYLRKYSKGLCFLFIISMLLYGMCFENIQTDSLFVCSTSCDDSNDTNNHASDFRLSKVSSPSDCIYSVETLGQKEAFTCLNPKTSSRGFSALWTTPVFLQSYSAILISHIHTSIHAIYSNAVILGYIHHKEGKKNTFLF